MVNRLSIFLALAVATGACGPSTQPCSDAMPTGVFSGVATITAIDPSVNCTGGGAAVGQTRQIQLVFGTDGKLGSVDPWGDGFSTSQSQCAIRATKTISASDGSVTVNVEVSQDHDQRKMTGWITTIGTGDGYCSKEVFELDLSR